MQLFRTYCQSESHHVFSQVHLIFCIGVLREFWTSHENMVAVFAWVYETNRKGVEIIVQSWGIFKNIPFSCGIVRVFVFCLLEVYVSAEACKGHSESDFQGKNFSSHLRLVCQCYCWKCTSRIQLVCVCVWDLKFFQVKGGLFAQVKKKGLAV